MKIKSTRKMFPVKRMRQRCTRYISIPRMTQNLLRLNHLQLSRKSKAEFLWCKKLLPLQGKAELL